jgi:hypothetical protein
MAESIDRLCTEARDVMNRVAALADLVIVSADGHEFNVSKSMGAAPSLALA